MLPPTLARSGYQFFSGGKVLHLGKKKEKREKK